ncbi:MAG: hypothetical protein M4579_004554 [Chaenotheca gracillima]|nr:MAG: hypothetical protein M4579_004554 [Chaenotheca gracillima]
MAENEEGGFLRSTLPSPPTSSVTSPSVSSGTLPTPRARPLRAGSSKETSFIQYVDRGILEITRRYAKKFSGDEGDENSLRGYVKLGEAIVDMERMLDVVWVSGSPFLQTPYLLSIALLLVTYLPSFPPSPKSMFRLLHKLDYAFSSLLQGQDFDSGTTLPGFENGGGLNNTQKVRIKSLVETTRVVVVDVMRSSDEREEEMDGGDEEGDRTETEDTDASVDEGMQDDGPDTWDMELARVYDRTIVQLGENFASDT